jgi:hypothetical protein
MQSKLICFPPDYSKTFGQKRVIKNFVALKAEMEAPTILVLNFFGIT